MTLLRVNSWQAADSNLNKLLLGDPQKLASWLRNLVQSVEERGTNLHLEPAVQDFQVLIESRAEIRMQAIAMFDEIPTKPPYNLDPSGHKQVRDYHHMLKLFNVIMTEIAPSWDLAGYNSGVVGAPFWAVISWPIGTPSGSAFFLREDVNRILKVILNTWRDNVLKTAKSRHAVTTNGGWLCKSAIVAIERSANVDQQTWRSFEELFICDPGRDPIHWGFQSWDDFFVRQFRDMDKIRPVANPNKPEWIINPCESRAIVLKSGINAYDKFWLKGQNYSVMEILDHHEFATEFIGGTIYQGYLDVTSYHRWTSPTAGYVIDTKIVDGAYWSEPKTMVSEGLAPPSPIDPDQFMVYISQIATRALIFIQAPEPIGLVCLIMIGIADISSCEISRKFTENLPQPIMKGEEIGMFHYGGSSFCIIFRKNVSLAWVEGAIPGKRTSNLPIRSALAVAYSN